MKHPLTPVEPPFTPEIADILAKYPQTGGDILTLFRVFANSTRFLKKGVPNLLDPESPLLLRYREVVILRTTANRSCEYEWGVHAAIFGGKAGFTAEQIRATVREGAMAPCWSPEESRLIAVTDELCNSGRLNAETRAAFEESWSPEQQLEICALIGAYHTVSFVANIANIDGETFALTFPAA